MLERIKNMHWKDVDWKKLDYPKIALTALFLLAMFLLGRAVGAATHGSAVAASAVARSPENWGLGFGAEGTQPSGNVSAAELAKYNAYYVGDAQDKVIYLTFDAGYENGNTEPILDALKKHNAPATFLWWDTIWSPPRSW